MKLKRGVVSINGRRQVEGAYLFLATGGNDHPDSETGRPFDREGWKLKGELGVECAMGGYHGDGYQLHDLGLAFPADAGWEIVGEDPDGTLSLRRADGVRIRVLTVGGGPRFAGSTLMWRS